MLLHHSLINNITSFLSCRHKTLFCSVLQAPHFDIKCLVCLCDNISALNHNYLTQAVPVITVQPGGTQNWPPISDNLYWNWMGMVSRIDPGLAGGRWYFVCYKLLIQIIHLSPSMFSLCLKQIGEMLNWMFFILMYMVH